METGDIVTLGFGLLVAVVGFFFGKKVDLKRLFNSQDRERDLFEDKINELEKEINKEHKTPKLSKDGVKEYWDEELDRNSDK